VINEAGRPSAPFPFLLLLAVCCCVFTAGLAAYIRSNKLPLLAFAAIASLLLSGRMLGTRRSEGLISSRFVGHYATPREALVWGLMIAVWTALFRAMFAESILVRQASLILCMYFVVGILVGVLLAKARRETNEIRLRST
jgi:hypothetical protein